MYTTGAIIFAEKATHLSIAYYISSHGFGHAARQSAIIRRLAEQGTKIYVRSAAPAKFFDFPNVYYHQQAYDVGLIQPDALHVDVEASFAAYQIIIDDKTAIIAQEVAFIQQNDIKLIVGDMPPLAFEIAAETHIPSVAITHFTWDWVYDHYSAGYPQAKGIIEGIRQMYGKATLALQLPFAHQFDMFPTVEQIPLLANTPTRSRDEICAELAIPPEHKIGLLSMGGMNWQGGGIDQLEKFNDWTFLVTPSIWEASNQQPNIRLIPTDFPNYHDLIAAADVVVGKAGGSTVAECIAHHTAYIYTTRADYRENELLDAALREHANSQFIPKDEFEGGAWLEWLNPVVARSYAWENIPYNGAEVAAQRLLQFI